MLTWLMEHSGTIVMSLLLLAAVAGIIISMLRRRRAGESSCGCGCRDCALKDSCHGGKHKGKSN